MEQSSYDGSKSDSWMQQARKWTAPVIFCAGFCIILILLMVPGESGIPGWKPANGALYATLSDDGDPAASPVPDLAAESGSQSASGSMSSPASSSVSTAMPGNSASEEAGQKPDSQPGSDTTAPHAGLLNLNAATAGQLQDLPGIGPAKAQAIVAYRESRSGFQTVDELLQVKGIGPKIFAQIAPLVTIGQGKK